jgi:hypothetical protein
MIVDPQSRWSTYGQEGAGYLNKAKQLNPNNPRLYYLEGAGIFGTPEQFGGGKTKAKPVLQKAVDCSRQTSQNLCIRVGDRNKPKTCLPNASECK